MSEPANPPSSAAASSVDAAGRLESWKEIAAYLRRDVTTVQRWEKREGMPVHRHRHDKIGSVYAFRAELDTWSRSRTASTAVAPVTRPEMPRPPAPWRRAAAVVAVLAIAVLAGSWLLRREAFPHNPLSDARFVQLTDFGGTEQAAAISRDGRFVAFLSDRDGRTDVWVTQVGTGQFNNLTRGFDGEMLNPSVRTLGFSPDGSLVTFWARRRGTTGSAEIGIWSVPVIGGTARPHLEGAAEFAVSEDGRLVYHTPAPGDPMFVRDGGRPEREIFSARAGLHAHFPVWAPDRRYIYFVQGTVPDHMDLWRVSPEGGTAERVTSHDSRVSHPVFAAGTLLYLATDTDGSGPWLFSLPADGGGPRRASVGLERYTSLDASRDGKRLVASLARPASTLWRLPLQGTRADVTARSRVSLATGSGANPAAGAGYLLYVSSKGESDGIWKLQGDRASELWSEAGARVSAPPSISLDGGRIAFVARRGGRASAFVVNADGTGARVVSGDLEVEGTPAWQPDGRALTVAAAVNGEPHLFTVPLDGGAPRAFVSEHAADPVWSPDGGILVYSGADVGTTSPLRAVGPDGRPVRLPDIVLGRGARRVAFLPGGRILAVLRGDMAHKDVWAIDLATGAERQIAALPADLDVRHFSISPDGTSIVLEQVRERSDIVLIERK